VCKVSVFLLFGKNNALKNYANACSFGFLYYFCMQYAPFLHPFGPPLTVLVSEGNKTAMSL
jgi:hypothetical protein